MTYPMSIKSTFSSDETEGNLSVISQQPEEKKMHREGEGLSNLESYRAKSNSQCLTQSKLACNMFGGFLAAGACMVVEGVNVGGEAACAAGGSAAGCVIEAAESIVGVPFCTRSPA